MLKFRAPMVVVALGLATATARSELFFTAEVLPTTGLTGFDTYRITATSDLGNIVGFDFSEIGDFGVFGALNQVQPFGLPTTYHDASWTSDEGRLQDTHFLLDGSDIVSLFNSESASALHGIFALAGDLQLSAGRNLPFLQITTQDLGSVSLRGKSVARRADGQLFEETMDIRLSDISIGPPPNVPLLPIPIPPADPVPPVVPPVVTPPSKPLPTVPPINPPSTPSAPPVAPEIPLDLGLGSVARVAHGQLYLTAEVAATVGRPGFDTYRLTATTDVGSVLGIDFSKVGSFGVTGPIGQVNPLGEQTVFTDRNSSFGDQDVSQDTQFLVGSEDVVSLFTEESESAFHGVFALDADGQADAGQSLQFLQISTPSASDVRLAGVFAVRAGGDIFDVPFEIGLADILVGSAPDVPLLPIPVPVVQPPVLEPPVVTQPDPVTPTPDPTVVDPNPVSEPPILNWEEILEREREWLAKNPRETFIELPGGDTEIPTGVYVEPLIHVWRQGEWHLLNVGAIDAGIVLPYEVIDGQIVTTVTEWDVDVSQFNLDGDQILYVYEDGLELTNAVFASSAGVSKLTAWHGRGLQSGLRTFLNGNAFIDEFDLMAQASGTQLDALNDAAQAPEPTSFLSLLIACPAALTCARRRHR